MRGYARYFWTILTWSNLFANTEVNRHIASCQLHTSWVKSRRIDLKCYILEKNITSFVYFNGTWKKKCLCQKKSSPSRPWNVSLVFVFDCFDLLFCTYSYQIYIFKPNNYFRNTHSMLPIDHENPHDNEYAHSSSPDIVSILLTHSITRHVWAATCAWLSLHKQPPPLCMDVNVVNVGREGVTTLWTHAGDERITGSAEIASGFCSQWSHHGNG